MPDHERCNPATLVDQIVVPRMRRHDDLMRFGSGVDFGSQGITLVEMRRDDRQIVKILAWFAGHRTPTCGIRGFGHVYTPARLQVTWRNGFESMRLHTGGRLSRSMLEAYRNLIDLHFGPGTLDQIDLRKTLVITDG